MTLVEKEEKYITQRKVLTDKENILVPSRLLFTLLI